MSSSTGKQVQVSIFGQSHAAAIGVVLDGIPAGEAIDLVEVQRFLARRAPGQGEHTTARKEADIPEILSGIVDGHSCGAPIAAVIRNTDSHAQDYEALQDLPRPSHADYPAQMKYSGWQDVRGGGHFSGRLTAPLCFAGAVCQQVLMRKGMQCGAHIRSIGGVQDTSYDPVNLSEETLLCAARRDFPVLDVAQGDAMQRLIAQFRQQEDSLGGTVECAVLGLPPGIGEPMFDGLENRIAQLIFAIPGVKGIEFGAGFSLADMSGKQANDAYTISGDHVRTTTNHNGGILGGLSTGMPLIFRVAIKPTPSIAQEQESVHLSKLQPETIRIQGRHDPCIVPRAVACVEAAAMLAVLDLYLEQEGRA